MPGCHDRLIAVIDEAAVVAGSYRALAKQGKINVTLLGKLRSKRVSAPTVKTFKKVARAVGMTPERLGKVICHGTETTRRRLSQPRITRRRQQKESEPPADAAGLMQRMKIAIEGMGVQIPDRPGTIAHWPDGQMTTVEQLNEQPAPVVLEHAGFRVTIGPDPAGQKS